MRIKNKIIYSKNLEDYGNNDDVHLPLIEENDEIYNAVTPNRRWNKCKNFLYNFNISGYLIHLTKKKIIHILIFFILICVHLFYNALQQNPIEEILVVHHSHVHGRKNYLVWSDKCKIPNIDPYDPEILMYFERQKYESCSTKKPWTSVQYNSTTKLYTLYIDEKVRKNYTSALDCCYQNILRNVKSRYADRIVKYEKCLSFNKSVQISNTIDNMLVKCKDKTKLVYINGYPMMPERVEIRNRLDAWKSKYKKRAPSILMIGIDSVSRTNLLRQMPKTAQSLYDNEWFEMTGYNKIEDNTFPNIMAILTGFNLTTANAICNPKKLFHLDNCPFIWKLFQDHGYVTAYGEDEVVLNTFNYDKKGFVYSPVDYYLRPFMIAGEKNFAITLKSKLTFCLGYQHASDYVFNYSIDLATRYKNDPFFGLFWANSFSHDDPNDCSSMDLKVVEYLEKLSNFGILNETVVIFFSDHGTRFGPSRNTLNGYFEERLPFMFIWLPEWLKIRHPEFVNGLSVNKNRLTNPYDIHMTLKHLLELSNRTNTGLPKATDCPNCQSLFTPVPQNRSCQDIGIDDHWCACIVYQSIEIKSNFSYQLAFLVVDYINNFLKNSKNREISSLCEKLTLKNIVGAYRANLIGDSYPKNIRLYLLIIQTLPGNGLFEATIRHEINTEVLEISGKISRINSYASDSKCISDESAKLYCHCPKASFTFWGLLNIFN